MVHRVGDIAFLEATLTTPDGMTIATAGATARVIPLDQRTGLGVMPAAPLGPEDLFRSACQGARSGEESGS